MVMQAWSVVKIQFQQSKKRIKKIAHLVSSKIRVEVSICIEEVTAKINFKIEKPLLKTH